MSPKMPKEHTEFRRKQIVEAAWDCFTEKGYHETTMRDVARRMNTSTGVIYRYFKSKDEILEAVNRCGQENTAKVVELAARKETTRKAIAELFRYYAEELSDKERWKNARGAIGLWAQALKRDNYLQICKSQQESFLAQITGLIDRGISRGEFKVTIDPHAFAGFIIALTMGLKVQSVLFPELDTSTYYESVQRIFLENIWRDDANPVPSIAKGE